MERNPSWRLVLDGGGSGAWNMAVDETLMLGGPATENPAAGAALPEPGFSNTLRLYWFEPICLSIGASQQIGDVDLGALAGAGIDVARRPSGGRAVLHDGCLTYSLSGAGDDAVFSGGIRPSYLRIAAALLHAIALLGVTEALPAEPSPVAHASPACFDHAAPYEPVLGGIKLAGSAQLRRGRRALQHGSLRLRDGSRQTAAFLRGRSDGRDLAGADPPALSALAGRQIGRSEAAAALLVGFEHAFGIRLHPTPLTPAERAIAHGLVEAKHGAAAWLERC